LSAERTTFETKDKLVIGIPCVVRIRPIIVQPQTVIIAFHIEDVRVTIAIDSMHRAVTATACLKEAELYFIRSITPQAPRTKLFLFVAKNTDPPREAVTSRALNVYMSNGSRKPWPFDIIHLFAVYQKNAPDKMKKDQRDKASKQI